MKNKVVSRPQWYQARRKLLVDEKKFSRLRDQLARKRSALPWEAVDKDYVFQGADGKQTLAELFAGRSQLIVYHFMFGPDWDAGCPHCSFWADNFDGHDTHLNQRDVSFVAVSRAPYRKLAAYRKRMGWSFKWLSSAGSDFNFDFQASFTPEELERGKVFYNFEDQKPIANEREGVSVFYRDSRGKVFHTYSTYARGIEDFNLDYRFMDVVPKGRDEKGRGQYWVKRHDEY